MKTTIQILKILTLILSTFFFYGCSKEEDTTPNDDDNAITCSDGIQNQGETGVDCGGPCSACQSSFTETFTAKINGSNFTATMGIIGASTFGNISLSGNDGRSIILIGVPSNITPGTYALEGFIPSGSYTILSSSKILTSNSGTLVITEHNTTNKTISGTFNFEATELPTVGTATASITNGVFAVAY